MSANSLKFETKLGQKIFQPSSWETKLSPAASANIKSDLIRADEARPLRVTLLKNILPVLINPFIAKKKLL